MSNECLAHVDSRWMFWVVVSNLSPSHFPLRYSQPCHAYSVLPNTHLPLRRPPCLPVHWERGDIRHNFLSFLLPLYKLIDICAHPSFSFILRCPLFLSVDLSYLLVQVFSLSKDRSFYQVLTCNYVNVEETISQSSFTLPHLYHFQLLLAGCLLFLQSGT